MGPEALEERFSPSELRRLQAEAEGLRERLVSPALRGRKRLRRRVTVGRTPLGECLRQLAEAQGQWEAVVKEEGALVGEKGQVTLLNLLEKGLALMERVQALRERPPKKRKRRKREEEPPGQAPQGETPPRQKKSGKGGDQSPEGGKAPEGRAARDGPGSRPSRGDDQEEDPGEEEGDHERGNEGGERPESDGDSSGNTEDERHNGDEDQDYAFWEDSDEKKDKSARCDSLLVKINNLEQKIFSLQDPSQEEVNDLVNEVEILKFNYQDISHDVERTLVYPVMDLWSDLWLFSFTLSVSALQETLSQFSAVEVGFAKVKKSDSLYGFLYSAPNKNAMLRFLLKKGQERINALQEKVDAVKDISPEQAVELKLKMDALQKQMGALKEMMALLAMTYKLFCKLWSGCIIEENAFWKKTRDLVLTIKVHLQANTQEESHLLWVKEGELDVDLHKNTVKKLMMLEEKVSACIRKLNVFQSKRWKPLEEELKFLKEKLHSLDLSHRELDMLQEELHEAQKDLDLQLQRRHETSESYHTPLCRISGRMMGTRQMIKALHKVDAPLVVNDEERNAGGCSGRTGNLNYSVSASAPHSSTGLSKTWHMEVTQKKRCVLVQNFAKIISPDNDSEAAKKILEAYAKQIEEEVYSLANSKTEYHHSMANKLNAMNRKLDETLRSPSPIHNIRRNEQPTLQSPCIQPAGVPSVAATTGEVQPPKLPSCARHSAAQERPPSELQAADDPRKALQIQETTTLNRPQRLDPSQPEGATCAESSGESLPGCEPAVTEGEGSEPPHKKQRMNPAGGTREPSLIQELFPVLQKHVSLAINRNMEKVSDMVSRLNGTALKDTEEAKALIAALKKALALLTVLFEYA